MRRAMTFGELPVEAPHAEAAGRALPGRSPSQKFGLIEAADFERLERGGTCLRVFDLTGVDITTNCVRVEDHVGPLGHTYALVRRSWSDTTVLTAAELRQVDGPLVMSPLQRAAARLRGCSHGTEPAGNWMLCEHANEVPQYCPCEGTCPCRTTHCKDRGPLAEVTVDASHALLYEGPSGLDMLHAHVSSAPSVRVGRSGAMLHIMNDNQHPVRVRIYRP